MASSRLRFRPNRQGIASFLKADGTRALIERKTESAADAASSTADAGGEFRPDVEVGPRRVRGAVVGDYTTSDPDVSRRALLRGLDGARGDE